MDGNPIVNQFSILHVFTLKISCTSRLRQLHLGVLKVPVHQLCMFITAEKSVLSLNKPYPTAL
jgi:hypothetical protein